MDEVHVIYKQEGEVGGYMGAPDGPITYLGATIDKAAAERFVRALNGKFRGGYLAYGFLTFRLLSPDDVDDRIRIETELAGK